MSVSTWRHPGSSELCRLGSSLALFCAVFLHASTLRAAPAAPDITLDWKGKGGNPATQPSHSVKVTLPSLPPSRTRIVFTERTQGISRFVEFDPFVSPAMVRKGHLTEGTWDVTLWAEPIHDPHTFATEYQWVGVCVGNLPSVNVACKVKIPGLPGTTVDDVIVEMEKPEKLETVRKRFSLPNRAAPSLSGRAFGATEAAPVLNELFTTIAEVVVERAKAQASQLLSDYVGKFVCEDLAWTMQEDKKAYCSLGPNIPFPKSDGDSARCRVQLLPATCKLIKRLRIEDLLGSGNSLITAALTDLENLVLRGVRIALSNSALNELKPFAVLVDEVEDVVAQLIAGKSLSGVLDAQNLLIRLSQFPWESYLGMPRIKPVIDAVRLGFAVMQRCQEAQVCDARSVYTLIQYADEVFDIDKATLIRLREYWPDLDRFVLKALDVLTPPKETTAEEQIENVVDLVAAMLEHVVFMSTGPALASFDAAQFDSGNGRPWLLAVRAIHRGVTGVIHRDAQPVLSAFVELVELAVEGWATKPDEMRLAQATKLLGAAASYLATYATPKNAGPEQIKAQHEARKRAISNLLDSAKDRSHRSGAWIFSLGAGAGFMAIGGERLPQTTNGKIDYQLNTMYTQLTLPVGVAVQRLPDSTHVGFHLQIAVLDLAQFIAYDSSGRVSQPTGTSWLEVGLTAGMLVGNPKTNVVIAADVRYVPSLFQTGDGSDQKSGSLRFGLQLSFYVPFWDFN